MPHSSLFYSFGGLRIESRLSLELPLNLVLEDAQSVAGSRQPQVLLRWGKVPVELDHAVVQRAMWQATPGQFLFTHEKVGRYLVTAGQEIVIEAVADVRERALINYLMSTAIGALLHQRGVLPLHASAVMVDGRGVAFAGNSGAGKSTLAAFLARRRGYSMLADDICVVDCFEDSARVFNGVPYIRLKEDAVAALDVSDTEYLPDRLHKKRRLLFAETQSIRPCPLQAVYLLEPDGGEGGNRQAGRPLSIERLPGSRATRSLMEHTFRSQYVVGAAAIKQYFKTCQSIANSVPVYALHVRRGVQATNQSMDEIMDLLETHWSG